MLHDNVVVMRIRVRLSISHLKYPYRSDKEVGRKSRNPVMLQLTFDSR